MLSLPESSSVLTPALSALSWMRGTPSTPATTSQLNTGLVSAPSALAAEKSLKAPKGVSKQAKKDSYLLSPMHLQAQIGASYDSGSDRSVIAAPSVQKVARGTNYSSIERDANSLRGLVPAKIETLGDQVARCLEQVQGIAKPLDRYVYLNKLRQENPTVHYKLVLDNLTDFLPLLYTPTVGEACVKFDKIWQRSEGMYVSAKDRGQIRKMLDNWDKPVDLIVVSDGSRILGLGDLGTNGMGIPVGKLSVYTAAAGFHPERTLPILLDTGCNTEAIRDSPHYLGLKHPRIPDEEYYPLVEEMLMAVKDKWPTSLLQFEDFSNNHCFELLARYRNRMRCFNDDIQGTGAVIAGGFLNACKAANVPLDKQRIVFYGAGSAGVGVADVIKQVMIANGMTPEQASNSFYLVDTKGLVTTTRGDELADHKIPYARKDMGTKQLKTLQEIVEHVRPTTIIGLSGMPGVFDEKILRTMGKLNKRPVIFALSNPTHKSECSAEQAYKFTDGRGIFASGSPFDPVNYKGKILAPGQGNNMYIFPGLGLGAFLCQASSISEGMVTASAQALAESVTPEQLAAGSLYPKIPDLREISIKVATRVIKQAQKEGLAQAHLPENLEEFIREHMWQPTFQRQ